MKKAHADQIAELINTHNYLIVAYNYKTVQDSLALENHYIFHRLDPGGSRVVGVVELRRVQWYQWEVFHLSVEPTYRRQGLGTQLLEEAEAKACTEGARLLQCTIFEDNVASKAVFARRGFVQVAAFYNETTESTVTVWQKVLSLPRKTTGV